LTKAAKKTLSYLFKATILVLAFLYIYHQYLEKRDSLKQFEVSIVHLDHTQVAVIMSAVMILMFANWITEALKWQYLTRRLAPISLWQAIEGIFNGLTWAIFTPNRIGEYGGRVMFLTPRKRIHGVFAMAVGQFGQNVITNVLGAGALVWFVFTFLHLSSWALIAIAVIAPIHIGLYLVFFFNIKWLVWLLNRIAFLKKYHRFFDIMGTYKFGELLNIMCFCLTRFFIFSSQYYLVVHLLVPAIPFHEVILLVFIFFFIQSAIPSLDLLDVPVRATVAVTLFAYVTHQHVAIIAAFASMSLINLIIPAIIGLVFTFNLKFFDRNL